MIKQFKNLVKAACHYYYDITNRHDFNLTIASKIVSLVFSTIVNLLKIAMFFAHKDVGMIYVRFP